MDEGDIRIESAPRAEDTAFIQDQLNAYNIAVTGYDDYQPLAAFVRDARGGIVAGLAGFTWGGTLNVEYLWVAEEQRRQGLGVRLLQAAEREALARGCRYAVLDTHSFQAPNFYPRHGYQVCGVAENWPAGHQQLYYTKRLGSATTADNPPSTADRG